MSCASALGGNIERLEDSFFAGQRAANNAGNFGRGKVTGDEARVMRGDSRGEFCHEMKLDQLKAGTTIATYLGQTQRQQPTRIHQ